MTDNKTFTLSIDWKRGDDWESKTDSGTFYGNLTWTMKCHWPTKKVRLECQKTGSTLWRVNVDIVLTVVTESGNEKAREHTDYRTIFSETSSFYDIKQKVQNPTENVDQLTISLEINVTETKGIALKRTFAFDRPQERFNFELKAGNKIFHVGKQLLIDNSMLFEDMFKKAQGPLESFTLDDTPSSVVPTALSILYNGDFTLTDEIVEPLLKLARRYMFLIIIEKCTEHLKFESSFEDEKKLQLASKFNLPEVEKEILKDCSMEFLNGLKIDELNETRTLMSIQNRRIELIEQMLRDQAEMHQAQMLQAQRGPGPMTQMGPAVPGQVQVPQAHRGPMGQAPNQPAAYYHHHQASQYYQHPQQPY